MLPAPDVRTDELATVNRGTCPASGVGKGRFFQRGPRHHCGRAGIFDIRKLQDVARHAGKPFGE